MNELRPGVYDCWRAVSWIAADSNGARLWESDPIIDRDFAIECAREVMAQNDRYHGPQYKRTWIETSLRRDVRWITSWEHGDVLRAGELAWAGRITHDWWSGDVVGVLRSSVRILGSGAIAGEQD